MILALRRRQRDRDPRLVIRAHTQLIQRHGRLRLRSMLVSPRNPPTGLFYRRHTQANTGLRMRARLPFYRGILIPTLWPQADILMPHHSLSLLINRPHNREVRRPMTLQV